MKKPTRFTIFAILGIFLIFLIISGISRHSGNTQNNQAVQVYNAGEFGFSFKYSSDFFVGDDTNEPDAGGGWFYIIPVAFKNGRTIEETGAIVISPRQKDPTQTALDWLKSPESGYDMAKGYKTEKVSGQEAISVENGDWVVVDTPDNKERLSIAILPPSATSTTPTDLASLRSEMTLLINSLFMGK